MRRDLGRLLKNASKLLFAVLLSFNTAAAQQSETAETDWHFRYEMFQMLLEQNGTSPVASVQNVLADPSRSVIVVMGDLNGAFSPRMLERFVSGGGNVLLATDQAYDAGRICQFVSGDVETHDPANQYHSYSDCIVVTDIDRSHPLMKGINSLVLNRTGWLSQPRWYTPQSLAIARLPRKCSPYQARRQPVIAEVSTNASATGKLIVVSDPSLFTNGMLWHGDNALMAINMAALLTENNRDQMLFAVDRQILSSYQNSPVMQNPPNIPDELPEPELATMLRVANSVLQNVQESNIINEGLANRPRQMRTPYYRRSLLFALLAIVAVFLIWKLSASGPVPQATMPARIMKSAFALSSTRKIESAEFGLAASMLARELCRNVTGSDSSADWLRVFQGKNAAGVPAEITEGHQHDARTVVDLAVNTRTVHLSRRRFEAIGKAVQSLQQAHIEGKLLQAASI